MITGTPQRLFAGWIVWGFLTLHGLAQSISSPALDRFIVDTWTTDEGLPQNSVTSIRQAPDGHLWMGTFGGAARFDGTHFSSFANKGGTNRPDNSVVKIHFDHAENLWLSTERGLACLEGGKWRLFGTNEGWPGEYAESFVEDTDGRLLVSTRTGSLVRRDGARLIPLPHPDPANPGPHKAVTMRVDATGRVWGRSQRFFGHLEGERWVPAVPIGAETNRHYVGLASSSAGGMWLADREEIRLYKDRRFVRSVLRQKDGQVYVGLLEDSRGNLWMASYSHGLFCFDPKGREFHFSTKDGSLPHDSVRAVMEDREGSIWAGTDGGGLVRIKPRVFATFGTSHGLEQKIVKCLAQTQPGQIWVGTHGGGLQRWQGDRFEPQLSGGSLPANRWLWTLTTNRAGELLVAGLYSRGVHRLTGGRFEILAELTASNREDAVFALATDAEDTCWIGSTDGLYRHARGVTKKCELTDGFPPVEVRTLAPGPAGVMWIGTHGSGVFRHAGGKFSRLTATNSPGPLHPTCLLTEGASTLWIGTRDEGLWRWKSGRFEQWAVPDATPSPYITCILDDGAGCLWLGTTRGIVRAERRELDLAAGGMLATPVFQVFTRKDGLATMECSYNGHPAGLKDSEGRLWFSTINGLSMIDPRSYQPNTVQPPVVVNTVLADGEEVFDSMLRPGGQPENPQPIKIPAGTQRMEIRWAALSFIAPDKARYQFMLEGRDKEWLDVGSRRVGYFYDLPPGNYKFRVRGANSDGVWNTRGAVLALSVEPLMWQTVWFRLLAVLTAAAAVGSAAWRVSHARLQRQIAQMAQEQAAQRAVSESEARFRLVAEQTGQIVYDYDPRSGLIRWAGAVQRLTGFTLAEFPASDTKGWAELIHPEDRPAAVELLEGCEKTGSPYFVSYRFRGKNGSYIMIEDTGVFLRDDSGTITRMLGVMSDISERRRMEEERARMDRKLQEAQKLESLGVVAGGIAHDFNNLLTTILGNASLARMALPTEGEAQPFLDRIEQTSRRAAELCQQMLAYAGRAHFVVQRVNLNALVHGTTHLLEISISKKAVLRFHLAPQLPAISADATQIRQVIMNLVINASEAIADRSGVIAVSTGLMRANRSWLQSAQVGSDLPEGDYVFFEVADSGCGMTPETLARIFDPFFTTKFTGRGLGLAAVLGIVRGHKGALQVQSEAGRGSIFRILFPPLEGPAQADSAPASVPQGWRGNGTVLVVEDEEHVRTLIARMLELFGFKAVLAADGREAIDQIRAGISDLQVILLDLTMPHMDGVETFRELRRLDTRTSVVLMSGFTENETSDRFGGEAPEGFLQKPFGPDQLRDKLRRTIEKQVRP